MEGLLANKHIPKQQLSPQKSLNSVSHLSNKQNQVGTVMLYGIPIVSLVIESQERLCLAQISNTLLKQYSYNEIHNRRVALGITCVQCTPVQLEILRRAGAMPVSSRRCGMITRREAERLCKSFLGDNAPPRLPDDFAFSVHHECAWGCSGAFLPSRYNSSRAKCIKCTFCGLFFSPNKFIFHSHRTSPNATYVQPDAANFNSWRRHMKLSGSPPDDIVHAWEDVKAMFNGGTRKRLLASSSGSSSIPIRSSVPSSVPITITPPTPKQIKVDNSTTSQPSYSPSNTIPSSLTTTPRVPPFPDLTLPLSMMDYVWPNGVSTEGMKQFPFTPYAVPWFGNARRSVLGLSCLSSMSSQQESLLQHLCPPNGSDRIYHHSAFRPVFPALGRPDVIISPDIQNNNNKRQIGSEEILLPKKKYSRVVEKVGGFSNVLDLNEDNKNLYQNVELSHSESFNKVDDFKKGAAKSDSQNTSPEMQSSGSPQTGNIVMTFKREFNSETSNDSDELPKFMTSKSRGQQENKELLDVSNLLNLKPAAIEENMLKFHDFSPNILEAITNLKAEDRGIPLYSGISTKNSQVGGDDKTVALEDCGSKRKEFYLIKDVSESDSRSELEEDDEPVDVESMDDIPVEKHSSSAGQEIGEVEKAAVKIFEEEKRSKITQSEIKSHKIWTIARFSVEEHEIDLTTTTTTTTQPAADESKMIFKNHNSELDNIKGSIPELKNKKSDCLSCWQVTYGKG